MRTCTQITRKSYKVLKGPEFKEKRVRKVADLNKSMLGNKAEVMDSTAQDLTYLCVTHAIDVCMYVCRRWRRDRTGAT